MGSCWRSPHTGSDASLFRRLAACPTLLLSLSLAARPAWSADSSQAGQTPSEQQKPTPTAEKPTAEKPTAEEPTEAKRELSDYELESLNSALREIGGATIERSPEGKRVESVEVVTLDVIEQRDPAPGFLNWFHVTTREGIIRREVLLNPGQTFDASLANETERNLREFAQFSVVLVQAVKGSRPDTVRILVVTKDVWSLRTSWEPSFYNGKPTYLRFTPAESNLLGTTQVVGANLVLDANNYWLGATYYIPRIGGSRINGYFSGSAAVNCQSGEVEGGSGVLDYGQPLYSTQTKWSWRVAATYSSQLTRPFAGFGDPVCSSTGPRLATIRLDDGSSTTTRDVAVLPYIYREEHLRSQFAFTRSLFTRNKVNLSFGLESDRRSYSTPDEYLAKIRVGKDVFDSNLQCWVSPQRMAERSDGIRQPSEADCRRTIDQYPEAPERGEFLLASQRYANSRFSDSRISPYVQLHAFESWYMRTLNYNTLGLQEDVQLGHNVFLRLYPSFRPLSSRDMLGMYASATYTWQIRDGFYRIGGSTLVEISGKGNDFQDRNFSGPMQSDSEVQFHSHLASPDIGFGRFVVGTALLDRPMQYIQFLTSTGGSDRLRGYAPASFVGRTLFWNNTEFRTRPVELFSTLIGLVAFWDVGHAANGLDQLKLRNGVGGGVRILFPQLDRQVFRLDFGFPAQADPAGEFTFTAGFRQAFDAPFLYPGALLTE